MTSSIGTDNPMTTNTRMLNWIGDVAKIAKPTSIVWITGDPGQLEDLRNEAWV